MRRVTRKPPKIFTAAMKTPAAARIVINRAGADLHQRAQDDDRRNRVRHRHQRRVQRMRHVPDHLEADEDRQHEDDEVLHKAGRCDQAEAQRAAPHRWRASPPACLVSFWKAATSAARFSSGVSSFGASFFGAEAIACHLRRRRREGDLALRVAVAPRITSSSMLWKQPRRPFHLRGQVGHHVADIVANSSVEICVAIRLGKSV